MSVEAMHFREAIHRSLCAMTVVIASLGLGAGMFYWHYSQEMTRGNVPKEWRSYQGSLKNGELWFWVKRASGNPSSPRLTPRLMRLNLETGEERETSFEFSEDYLMPVWIGDDLYVYAQNARNQVTIYQIVGDSTIKLEPALSSHYLSVPFSYDGKLTVVYDASGIFDSSNESVRLAHWVDGRWIDGRQVILPSFDQFWFNDAERGRKVLLARTSKYSECLVKSPTAYYFPYTLLIVRNQRQIHLMNAGPGMMCPSYRNGFEFADETPECSSAIAAENAPPEATGWAPILDGRAFDSWVQMTCDREGLLFCSTDRPNRFARQEPDGRRIELKTAENLHAADESEPWIAADPAEPTAYVVFGNGFWGSASVCRIHENTIQPPHLAVPGFRKEYLARWWMICLRLSTVWLLATLVLFGGTLWVSSQTSRAVTEGLPRQFVLAGLVERSLAFIIDVSIVLFLSWLLWRFALWSCGLVWTAGANRDLAEVLATLEGECRYGQRLKILEILRDSPLNWLVLPIDIRSDFFGILMGSMLLVCLLKIYCEGRFGLTPGKWLLGLSTIGTTFRPCGFARALARNFLFCFDIPLLLTPIPAAICFMLSDQRQRIGDRVADTIVVRKKL